MSVKSSRINKQSREQADSLPNENKLLSMYDDTKFEKLQEMYSLGAKVIFLEPSFSSFNKTILTSKALCFKSSTNRFYVTPPSLYAEIKFDVEKNTATYTTTKNKSAVGRAIVGGALAGGAGAVVGAASAMSGDGKKTVSRTYNTGDYRLKIKLSDISHIEPTILYVSNELINQIGQPFINGQEEENSPYTKYDISRIDMVKKNRIVEYLQKAINTR
jgi:hypothetical protein